MKYENGTLSSGSSSKCFWRLGLASLPPGDLVRLAFLVGSSSSSLELEVASASSPSDSGSDLPEALVSIKRGGPSGKGTLLVTSTSSRLSTHSSYSWLYSTESSVSTKYFVRFFS